MSQIIMRLAVLYVAVTLVALFCSGCGSQNGWRVSFGVAPVSAIDDRAAFQREDAKRTERRGE